MGNAAAWLVKGASVTVVAVAAAGDVDAAVDVSSIGSGSNTVSGD